MDTNASGSFPIMTEEIEVGGYVCGGTQNATIWRP